MSRWADVLGRKHVRCRSKTQLCSLTHWSYQQSTAIAERILFEIRQRIHFLVDVGLDYLTLDRLASTLSGGEAQRIQLATNLGSSRRRALCFGRALDRSSSTR